MDVSGLAIPGGTIDFERCEVRFTDGAREELSERERELLRYLACHTGRAISRDELLTNVWKIDARGVSTRTIDMHVARLREKLRDSDGDGRVLVTVRGKGYMWARNDGMSNDE
jgi:DNA-binding response OmpR family regulator